MRNGQLYLPGVEVEAQVIVPPTGPVHANGGSLKLAPQQICTVISGCRAKRPLDYIYFFGWLTPGGWVDAGVGTVFDAKMLSAVSMYSLLFFPKLLGLSGPIE